MASAALPVFFPAVRINDAWYGDGGVRLSAPLSPALHLGANRILAVSTRMMRTQQEAAQPMITQYPPPAQILGTVFNAVFLDLIDQDALRLNRLNRLLEKLPEDDREGLKPVRLLVIRPSLDLGRLAAAYEPKLPPAFKFMTRGLGTRETSSPDILSMLLFQKDYLTRLIEIGEADAEARADEIEQFLFEYGVFNGRVRGRLRGRVRVRDGSTDQRINGSTDETGTGTLTFTFTWTGAATDEPTGAITRPFCV